MAGINPFRPNLPVHATMFVGRAAEVERLEGYLRQTKAGNPVNFLITGERGIGKSSLLHYIKALAEGDVRGGGQDSGKYLVIDTAIDRDTTVLGLVEKISLSLKRSLARTEAAKAFLRDAWGFVQRLEVAGVRLNSKDQSREFEPKALEEFAYSLIDTVRRVCSGENGFDANYCGVLLLIDEADNATMPLGSFLKTLSERLARGGCDRLMFGLGGLPAVLDVLHASHESSLRLFEVLLLEPLTTEEVEEVIDISLRRAQRDNETEYQITAEATDRLIELSDGVPHFIQQFGYSAFDADTDRVIDEADVLSGALDEHGAVDQVGLRYFRGLFAGIDGYERALLKAVAAADGAWVAWEAIVRTMDADDSTIDAAIRSLGDRGILNSGFSEGQMAYRVHRRAFSMWIARQA